MPKQPAIPGLRLRRWQPLPGPKAADGMRTSLSETCLTADTAAKNPRKRPPTTRPTAPEAIKPPFRRSRTRRSDDPYVSEMT